MMFSRFQLGCIWLEQWFGTFFQLVKRSWNNLRINGTCHVTCGDKSWSNFPHKRKNYEKKFRKERILLILSCLTKWQNLRMEQLKVDQRDESCPCFFKDELA